MLDLFFEDVELEGVFLTLADVLFVMIIMEFDKIRQSFYLFPFDLEEVSRLRLLALDVGNIGFQFSDAAGVTVGGGWAGPRCCCCRRHRCC